MARQPTTWDRLPNESGRAYAAFLVYRDLGPGRSLLKASRVIRGQQEGNERQRLSGHWGRWSSQYQWVARATRWDQSIYDSKEQLARHNAIDTDNFRYRRHMSSVGDFDPVLKKFLRTLLESDMTPLDACRILRELRTLEGSIQAGFGPRYGW